MYNNMNEYYSKKAMLEETVKQAEWWYSKIGREGLNFFKNRTFRLFQKKHSAKTEHKSIGEKEIVDKKKQRKALKSA